MWAPSTFDLRRCVWDRLQAWCQRENLPITEDSAVLFVAAAGVSPQSELTYAKALSALFGHLGWERQCLLTYCTALRAQGAAIPIAPARPLDKSTLTEWLLANEESLPRGLLIAVMLAWKTASRWDEVSHVTRRHFVQVDQQELIVDWFRIPKLRKANPFVPSRYGVVVGDWTCTIAAYVATMLPDARLTDVSTAQLRALWSRDPMMEEFTCHSIKRGALTHLGRALDAGADIDPWRISLLAKHDHTLVVGKQTLRYIADPIAMARLHGTQHVTKFL